MLTVGITGQIASGKSLVARAFARAGAEVISGDELGREVLTQRNIITILTKAFGRKILSHDGSINRRRLARVAFANQVATTQLNAIVHPQLLAKLKARIQRYRKARRTKILVVDAALIYDWRLERELDFVIVVECKRATQLLRLKKAGFSESEIRDRIRRQLPKSRQRQLADRLIRNDGSLTELERKASAICTELSQRALLTES